ncbi:hypothetical protein Hdeb2414_s0020g00552521 [Helianthus debilis subsp. tardiflorus]
METNPPTSELMSPVHSFPNRFFSSDFHNDEEFNAPVPVRSPDVVISNNFMNSAFHDDEVMDNAQGPSNPYFVFDTPQGTRYWIPNVADKFIPVCGKSYPTFADVLSMYELYAFEAGFSVKKKGKLKSGMEFLHISIFDAQNMENHNPRGLLTP